MAFNSTNCGPAPAGLLPETATLRAKKLAQWDAEVRQLPREDLASGKILDISRDWAADLIFSTFHQTDPQWWFLVADFTLADLSNHAKANLACGGEVGVQPFRAECLECGAVYDRPGIVDDGGMGCPRCNR